VRKAQIIEHIPLGGVIQHSADDGDFPYSDWTAPYRTPTGRDAILTAQSNRFDLLLGRRTYDTWVGLEDRIARRLWISPAARSTATPGAGRSRSTSLHVKIRAEAREFDPAYEEYFYQRWLAKCQGRLGLRTRRSNSRLETRQPGEPHSRIEKSA
jgi:hypothetical protein